MMFTTAAGRPLHGSTASFIRIARHQAFRRHAWTAHVRWLAAVAEQKKQTTLARELQHSNLMEMVTKLHLSPV